MFCGLLALGKALPTSEIIESFMDFNETDRDWFTDIPSQVHLTFYPPGGRDGLTFHVNEDPAAVANAMYQHGFNAMIQTKILSHGFTSSGTKFCPQFVEGNFRTHIVKDFGVELANNEVT